ncbi:hypothetical protein CH376_06175 [Leptospira adleri]|uniref:PH domain-containing protein n=1 Tax=Leptospira adleri TaxID=2023186 RepID=A0ABX4P1A3_9LEPT|nr:hypothetical protein CH376_06175 [Leptospira adleri]
MFIFNKSVITSKNQNRLLLVFDKSQIFYQSKMKSSEDRNWICINRRKISKAENSLSLRFGTKNSDLKFDSISEEVF